MPANYFLSTMYGLSFENSELDSLATKLGLDRGPLFDEGTGKFVAAIAETPSLENIGEELTFIMYQSLNYDKVVNEVYVLLKSTFRVENVNQSDGKSTKTVIFRNEEMNIVESEKKMLELFLETFNIEGKPDALTIATLMDI